MQNSRHEARLEGLVTGHGSYGEGFRSAIIQLRPVDRYTLVPDYDIAAYVHDPGIIWEDYTGDFPRGSYQPTRGYIYPFLKRGARNPYRGDNTSDEVKHHEVAHYQRHYQPRGGGPDEERELRREERYMGWGTDYNVKL